MGLLIREICHHLRIVGTNRHIYIVEMCLFIMIKTIQQVTGTQVGITFTKNERKKHGIKVGGEIDMTDCVISVPSIPIETLKDMTIGEIKKLTESI